MTTRTPLSGAAFASQRCDGLAPARIEVLAARGVVRRLRGFERASFAVSACATSRDVVRIELHVRIAQRMDVAHARGRASTAPPAT